MPSSEISWGQIFPAAERVVYDKSPLVEVVCQLRFPTILRIEAEVPSDFQELVRGVFPLFERQAPQVPGLPPELARMLGNATQQPIQYNFTAEDGKQRLSLAPDFLALTSHHYSRWERFLDVLNPAIEALQKTYKPSFYTRLGLRYQNRIEPDSIGAADVPWSRLLGDSIVGEFRNDTDGSFIFEEAGRQLRLRTTDRKFGVLLQHGLGFPSTPDTRVPYVIDTDVYTDQKTEVGDVLPILKEFNTTAGRVFRWAISSELHDLLGPKPVR